MLRPLPIRFSLAAISILAIVLVFLIAAQHANRTLRIFVPATKGDGVLVITPDGHTMLIDGGSDGATLATWLGRRLPFGQRRIDTLVLTRADDQTLPGQLAALRRYDIGAAFLPPIEQRSNQIDAWHQLLHAQTTPVEPLASGSRIRIGECTIDVLEADRGHATLVLQCDQTTAYFLQSITNAMEQILAAEPLPPATLVVYPWKRSTQNDLLERIQPSTIVFSEGGKHTVQQSFAQRQIGAAQLFHEAIHGEISLVSDGQQTRISTERKEEQ